MSWDRCSLCPNANNCVQGVGPLDADILALGEAPGKDEDKERVPFIGKTGREVDDTYLPLTPLKRFQIRIDNTVSCWPDTSDHKLDRKKPKQLALIQCCAEHHLYPYLRQHPKQLIIAMGAIACWALDPEIELDLHHGIPLDTKWGPVFPMNHPAMGMHDAKKMKDIYADWAKLGEYLRGKLYIPVDPYPNPDYKSVTVTDIKEIDPTVPMANDTEWSRSLGSYCLTYSQEPGHSRLIMAGSPLFEAYQKKIAKWESEIYFHNWMADKNTTRDFGLKYIESFPTLRDTMNVAFHLGVSRIGLKNLAYRKLGMEMTDFDDVVIPHSSPVCVQYLREALLDHEWPRPPAQIVIGEDGMEKPYRPQSMATKFKTLFTYLNKDPNKNVFEAWENWEDNHGEIEAKCGMWPGKDIAHVPYEEMKHYACRDADATIRLMPILDEMVANAESGLPQEKW